MVQLVNLIKRKEGKNLSRSAYKILEILEQKETVSPSEIMKEMEVSTRTIHYSLRRLLERNILERKPFLGDMRKSRYMISEKLRTELGQDKFSLKKV